MKKYLLSLLIAISTVGIIPLSASAATCTNTFPTALNNYTASACIPSAWANALEDTIGTTGSIVTSSLNYLVVHVATSSIVGLQQYINSFGFITTSTNLTVANLASPNISQFTNNVGYVTSTSGGGGTVSINNIATSTFSVAAGAGVSVTSSTGGNGGGVITITSTGSGSSTVLYPGTGISLSPNPITTTGTVSLANPAIVGGNETSSISGSSSTPSVIQNLNNVQYVPQNYATAGCGGIPGPMNWQTCVYDIYASMAPIGGGTIMQTFDVITSSTTGWTGTLSFNINGDQVSLNCTTNVILRYSGTSTNPLYTYLPSNSNIALNFDFGNPLGHARTSEDGDCDLRNHDTLISPPNTNTATSTGIYYGGTWTYTSNTLTASTTNAGAVGVDIDYNINGFGRNVWFGANAYVDQYTGASSGGNCGNMTGCLFFVDIANNSGERWVIQGGTYTDPGNSTTSNAIYLTNAGTASIFFNYNSVDDAQIYCGASDGLCDVSSNHIENPAYSVYHSYIPIINPSSDRSTMINASDEEIANDTSGANSFSTLIKHGGQLVAIGNHIDNYGGGTIATFSDHSNDNGVESELICQLQVQGGALTNIVGGGGNIAYSLETGSGCVNDEANSYPIEWTIASNNTVSFRVGTVIAATTDHAGDWTFGLNGSSVNTFNGNTTFNNNVTVDGNLKGFNSFIFPPTVTTSTSVTLGGSSAKNQVYTGTTTSTYTLFAVNGNIGYTFDFKNRGTGEMIVNATGTDTFFLLNGATSTSLTLGTGSSTEILNDGTDWDQIF